MPLEESLKEDHTPSLPEHKEDLQKEQPDIDEKDYFSRKTSSPSLLLQEKENSVETLEDISSSDSKNQNEPDEETSSDLWENEKSLFNNLNDQEDDEDQEDTDELFNPSADTLTPQTKNKLLKDIQNEILSLTESKNQDKLDLDEE